MDLFLQLFSDYTLRTVALGTAIIGVVSGALGTFALLRRQSLLGDAISHAALPGVVLAFIITRSRGSLVLIVGALIAGWLATLLVMAIVRSTRLKEDTALGIALSVFFGFGLVLLTYTQRLSDARQAGLDRFLFGQAAALLSRDIWTMGIIGGIALLLLVLFWKEFKLLSFDGEFAGTLGLPVRALDLLLTTLLTLAIVIGLQAVGVILMSAMVVAPAAAARQWTNRLSVMVVLSSLFGALSGIAGAFVSSLGSGLATGPVIVLAMSVITFFSLVFAANRGLWWNWLRQRRHRRRLRRDSVLTDLYILGLQHDDPRHPHSAEALRVMNLGRRGISHTLATLMEDGLTERVAAEEWALTAAGVAVARDLLAANVDSQNELTILLKEGTS